ncbi:CoA pyrophosphatase [Allopusillimonas soli]|uniref:CoA pyrophosphatase n=1 Tax=Allopusillimonas soli TaxID=659016 RepID=A0A853F460_9BURK|nr:CoA pyrophosphatase [Allopusillimonas soli]NYT35284.1 CoA pyrophosphatase [Allopusillimonas soli]TEA75707.1 CoA pyrophosphatase [Allopusillimonas soli]
MPDSLSPPRRTLLASSGFDPQQQPVVPAETLPPLLSQSLQLDFIRAAFGCTIDWNVEPLFSRSFQADAMRGKDLRQAAVFFPLLQRQDGLHVLFTERASHLSNHAGQVSFPGGRIEPTDKDVIAAALRETHEEIGVGAEFIQLIGTQPAFLTSTRFTMKPVIGVILPGYTLAPDPSEVAEVFEVPLSVLMDTRRHRLHRASLPGGGHRFYFSITWQSHFIWGATAALIRNFYHYLAAAELTLGETDRKPAARPR